MKIRSIVRYRQKSLIRDYLGIDGVVLTAIHIHLVAMEHLNFVLLPVVCWALDTDSMLY